MPASGQTHLATISEHMALGTTRTSLSDVFNTVGQAPPFCTRTYAVRQIVAKCVCPDAPSLQLSAPIPVEIHYYYYYGKNHNSNNSYNSNKSGLGVRLGHEQFICISEYILVIIH